MAKFKLSLPDGSLSGTFTLTVDGGTTANINAPGTAAAIQSALRAVSGEDAAEVRGSNGGPYTVTVASDTLTVDGSAITGATGGTASVEPDAGTAPTAPGAGAGTTGTTYEELAKKKGKLIRKVLNALILVAPMSAPFPEKFFTDGGKLVDFKALGYQDVGWVTKSDGLNFARETESSEIESFGAQEPTRIDFIKDTTSVSFVMQETNRAAMELYFNKDLSNTKVDANGELQFEEDFTPEARYRRMIFIGRDGIGDNEFIIIKGLPKAIVSEIQEQGWSTENELKYGLTVKGTKDDELNFALRHGFGGKGFEALVEDMGFQKA